MKKKNSKYLRLVSGDKKIIIPECKGGQKANFAYADDVFTMHLDPDIYHYGLNHQNQVPTKETQVHIYEMYGEDTDFYTLFTSLSTDLKSLAFASHEQIIKFAKYNRMEIYEFGNLFLFKEKNKFFVANVDSSSGGLFLNVCLLTAIRGKLLANIGYRVVIPVN